MQEDLIDFTEEAALHPVNAYPETLEARRRELIGKIDEENVKLSDAVERIKRLKTQPATDRREPPRGPIERAQWSIKSPVEEMYTLQNEIATMEDLEADLAREPLGNPKWIAELFAAQKAIEWGEARHRDALKHVERNSGLAGQARLRNEAGNEATYSSRNPKWAAELKASQAALDAAKAEAEALYRKLVEE